NNIYLGVKNKFQIYSYLKERYSLKDEEICYLGDDIQDLDILKVVGLSCCPDNAQEIVKDNCIYVSPYKGGKGFVRDVCNLILENV
ncbi:MAG: HAD hydrolase family protein, partial [Candidatus Helarchaeota archaeon]